jgi:hypothetical protein
MASSRWPPVSLSEADWLYKRGVEMFTVYLLTSLVITFALQPVLKNADRSSREAGRATTYPESWDEVLDSWHEAGSRLLLAGRWYFGLIGLLGWSSLALPFLAPAEGMGWLASATFGVMGGVILAYGAYNLRKVIASLVT